MIRPVFNKAVKDLRLSSEATSQDGFHDRGTIFVAPIKAKLEPDKYECYDRTDLAYQHALALDGENAMLLANYAQFLYVVRHDHDRAEKYFQRAMNVVSSDGEAMSKFAMFLWLARKNRSAAERLFKAAIDVDTTNPFNKGDYAHFLLHAEE